MKLFRGLRMSALSPEDEGKPLQPRPSFSGSDSDSLDESARHSRNLDPSAADIYLDALFGPLLYRFERIQKEKHTAAHWSDYRLVSFFLLLNVALQLGIAFKIYQVTNETYGDVGEALFGGACWRVSSADDGLTGLLYPPGVSDPSHNDFDCVQPFLTLAMFPAELDVNKDGFWSPEEAHTVSKELQAHGSSMATSFRGILRRMVKFDAQRANSKSTQDPERLDMDFFQYYRSNLQMCLPVDPNLCGNLEVAGTLAKILHLDDPDDRVDACVDNYHSFCEKLLGGNYQWIHHTTAELCGSKKFSLENGINVVSYDTVSVYKGETDSIWGTAFASFLMLMLFLWGMLMLTEFRAIYNFAYVIIKMPSTSDTDLTFAEVEDSKMLVKQLPQGHKIYALLCIVLPRCLIGVVVLAVGTHFLTATDNLLDLVLNSTALSFLMEVDEMIHASMLGEGFERHVTDQCEVMQVYSEIRGTWQPYAVLLFVGCGTAGWTAYAYFNPFGLKATGDGMECLCHFAGNCWASSLI